MQITRPCYRPAGRHQVKFPDNRLRELRRAAGKSLASVESETGISEGLIRRYERGEGPRFENAVILARFYGVTLDYAWNL